jgi:hypothetical protein
LTRFRKRRWQAHDREPPQESSALDFWHDVLPQPLLAIRTTFVTRPPDPPRSAVPKVYRIDPRPTCTRSRQNPPRDEFLALNTDRVETNERLGSSARCQRRSKSEPVATGWILVNVADNRSLFNLLSPSFEFQPIQLTSSCLEWPPWCGGPWRGDRISCVLAEPLALWWKRIRTNSCLLIFADLAVMVSKSVFTVTARKQTIVRRWTVERPQVARRDGLLHTWFAISSCVTRRVARLRRRQRRRWGGTHNVASAAGNMSRWALGKFTGPHRIY